jgi:AcrR family transcriptional regulator
MAGQRTPQRADSRRNRERLLAAASEIVERDGASASLEEIARRAGVGSATLHRHFHSRRELLTEVFLTGVQQIVERAVELNAGPDDNALAVWLDELVRYTASTRGLAVSLGTRGEASGCHGLLEDVATELMASAVKAGRLRPGISPTDLLAVVNGIATQAENDPDMGSRLLAIALEGIGPV